MNASQENVIPEKWAGRFFTFWVGQAFSLIGSSLVQFALVWWMTTTTGSATVLATASLLAVLPNVILAPFAGALVDRWNRRLTMIAADGAIALATLTLVYLFAVGRQSLAAVYVILFVRAVGGVFHSPAESASISLMVPKEHLARIAGLNQTLQGALNIVAPPIGALLIGILPMQGVLAVDIVTALIAISILAFIHVPQPQAGTTGAAETPTTFVEDLRGGLAYVRAWPGLLAVMVIAMAINFLAVPSGALLPLMVTQEYHGSAMQLGLVDSLFGIGIIAGGVVLSAWGGFKKRILTSMMGIAGIGLGILIFGLLPSNLFYAALSGIFMLGFMQVLANGPLHAILQSSVAPQMQGRVFSLIGAGASAMQPLSLIVAGPISDWLGVRTWYAIGGLSCVLMALAALFIPVIMKIEENRSPLEAPAL